MPIASGFVYSSSVKSSATWLSRSMATCKSWVSTPVRDLGFGRVQQSGIRWPSRASQVSFSQTQGVKILANMAAAKTPFKLEKVVLTSHQIEKVRPNLSYIITIMCTGETDRLGFSNHTHSHQIGRKMVQESANPKFLTPASRFETISNLN